MSIVWHNLLVTFLIRAFISFFISHYIIFICRARGKFLLLLTYPHNVLSGLSVRANPNDFLSKEFRIFLEREVIPRDNRSASSDSGGLRSVFRCIPSRRIFFEVSSTWNSVRLFIIRATRANNPKEWKMLLCAFIRKYSPFNIRACARIVIIIVIIVQRASIDWPIRVNYRQLLFLFSPRASSCTNFLANHTVITTRSSAHLSGKSEFGFGRIINIIHILHCASFKN